ncbi:m085R [Myxoma virus]|uniref:M085R n=2 Tax=Myxoma virus TaxID=10273 RepID=Q9Q8L5_MYXVL|nr:m085R [Myxoma virus]pir/C36819/ C11 protein - rabbit fibroma virus [Rabbit fibroma virus]ACB28880.1 m085R [recombinant virus 6918VP60-T2]AAF14973.1 m085R [Myxoma virus]ACB28708.1 m085R [Myxoma virus]AFU77017.1 m085R [Myxoma virus]AFU77184.1 m085R [Myxoma virus]
MNERLQYSHLMNYITQHNRKLSKTYTWTDDAQRVSATAFNNQRLRWSNKTSICLILSTLDNKFIACSRKHSFLYSEIVRCRSVFRKKRLFLTYTKFLKKIERPFLSSKLNVPLDDPGTEHNDIIFPGGLPKNEEDPIMCLSREIKEEINIDSKDIYIDSRFFVHLFIEDLLSNRIYETILFLGKTTLTSHEILNNFLANREIKSLVFLDTLEKGVMCDVLRYVLAVSRLKCFGSVGDKTELLYDKVTESVKKMTRYGFD